MTVAAVIAALDETRPETLLAAIAAAKERLKSGGLRPQDVEAISSALLSSARSSEWRVREAVALALPFVDDRSYLSALALFGAEDDDRVLVVLDDAERKRRKRREGDGATALAESLDGLEQRFGSKVREPAQRLADEHADAKVFEAYHEILNFMTPLAQALDGLEGALDAGKPRLARRYSREASRAFDELQAVAESVTQLTRRVELDLQPLRLDGLVAEVLAGYAAPLAKAQVVVEAEVDGDIVVELDRISIKQVCTNILKNSLEAIQRAGRKRPRLRIAGYLEPRHAVLAFRDNGDGIRREMLERVFERRVTTKKSGSGAGLALAQRLVVAHGGTIVAQSERGRWTEMTIRLPRRAEREE